MKLVCDEGVEAAIVHQLRRDGHEVTYISEEQPGLSDDCVLRMANDFDAPVVTNDKDFGEFVFRQRRANHGVVLLRLAGLSAAAKASATAAAVRDHENELREAFTVVSPGMIRIRRSHPAE